MIAFSVFTISLLLAYYIGADQANPTGCDQMDDLERRVCEQSQRPTGTIDQVKALVVVGGIYLVLALWGLARWWNPATFALALSGFVVLLMAIYGVAVSPTNAVRTAGAAWIVVCFIIILAIWWIGSWFGSPRAARGGGCCRC